MINKTATAFFRNVRKWLNANPELKLITVLSRPIPANKTEIAQCIQNVNWNHFIQSAEEHGLLYLCIQRLGEVEEIELPCGVAQELETIKYRLGIAQMQAGAELADIVKIFTTDGIEFVVLKGLPLAQRVYSNLFYRQSVDNDVFINSKQATQAAVLIERHGWIAQHKTNFALAALTGTAGLQHHTLFTRNGITLELHGRLHPWSAVSDSNELFDKPVEYAQLGNTVCPVLNNNLQLQFLARHGASHGFSKLKWLCDIAWAVSCETECFRTAAISNDRVIRAALLFAVALGILSQNEDIERDTADNKALNLAIAFFKRQTEWDFTSKKTYLTRNYLIACGYQRLCIDNNIVFAKYLCKRLICDVIQRTSGCLLAIATSIRCRFERLISRGIR